jgi:hypothetical protein
MVIDLSGRFPYLAMRLKFQPIASLETDPLVPDRLAVIDWFLSSSGAQPVAGIVNKGSWSSRSGTQRRGWEVHSTSYFEEYRANHDFNNYR